jgi:SAM-dependent methyltransferase
MVVLEDYNCCMAIIDRALEVYRKEGLVTLGKKSTRYLLKKVGIIEEWDSQFSYQLSRMEGVETRFKMIKPYIDNNTSVLDIGSNAGMITAKLAEEGVFAIGIELKPDVVADAREYHEERNNLAFINSRVSLETLPALPQFDVVLLLSVYHQWYEAYGEETAKEMLSLLARKTNQRLFFEAAGQKSKYGDSDLPFTDFDENTIVDYNLKFLNQLLSDGFEITYLGPSPRRKNATGERYVFMCECIE